MSRDPEFASIAEEIDAIAERLLDHSMGLLRSALGNPARQDAAATERIVTRARRSLDKASSLLRGIESADDEG